MNNLDDENIRLIDISLEDDFLIDDNSSLDLRLSVAFETQMELVCDIKPQARVEINDRIQYLADREPETYQLKRECGDNVRNSLAWDTAFFTSPGFLELEELCLVNTGFTDPQRRSVCGDSESVRRKVCLERNSGNKAGVPVRRRQNTQPLVKAKLTSLAKMVAVQDSQHQLMTSQQSEAFRGETSKSKVITGKKEYLKSGKAKSQIRLPTEQNRKSPLQGLGRNGKTRTLEIVSSSLPHFSFTATNTSVDLSPYRSKDSSARTVNATKSQETKGECFSRSHSPISVDRQNKDRMPQAQQKVISGRGLQRQNATRATKSPLSANSHKSPKPSSLRLPSYFDMESVVATMNESSLLSPESHINSDVKPKTTPPILLERKAYTKNKADIYQDVEVCSHDENVINPSDKEHKRRNHPIIGKDSKEKENMLLREDTVIEPEPKQRSPLPLQSGTKGSSISSKPSNSSRILPPIKTQRPTGKSNISPIGTRKPFSTRISPLKRSAFF